GRLAHRGGAKEHAGVARREERPETVLLDVGLAHDARVVEPEALEAAREVEAGRLGADEQEPRAGMRLAEPCERAQELRDALALVQVSGAAEERRAADARRLDVAHRPGRMRDPPERPVVAVLPHVRL